MISGRRLAVGALLLTATSCLLPPVSETLEIRLLGAGRAIVSVGVALKDPADYDKAPKMRERLEAEARSLDDRTDPWSARLKSAEPLRERSVVDLERGSARRVVRHALLDEPDKLRTFLRDSAVDVTYAEGDGWAELTLSAGPSMRATSAQRQRVKRELESFAEHAEAYVAAVAKLYAYLDDHPERAKACLGTIVADNPEGESIEEDEESQVGEVNDALAELAEVLEAEPAEAYTRDEISGLVFDPFPAPIRVFVPGPILEREGFRGELEAPLEIPAFTLWSAFARLEGRWIAPDPGLAMWRHELAASGQPFDLAGFLARPRRAAAPPAAREIRRALEAELTPAAVYRVRWAPTDAEVPEDWPAL
ncbi:MAG TPA: hypothetical protein VJS92_18175 [Candidatus Polarisedimenticolaceae bacterium]|nr:hypothetical protein [Candidatus Polarisedimenticolaceae bacterium]